MVHVLYLKNTDFPSITMNFLQKKDTEEGFDFADKNHWFADCITELPMFLHFQNVQW